MDFQLKRVSQASVIKRERIVKKRLRIKRPKERSRGLGALATELAQVESTPCFQLEQAHAPSCFHARNAV